MRRISSLNYSEKRSSFIPIVDSCNKQLPETENLINIPKNDATHYLDNFKADLNFEKTVFSINHDTEKKNENYIDEMDDQDNEMMKNYMKKYGGLRRHTIGTNMGDNHKNDIMKSLECLFNLEKNCALLKYNEGLSDINEVNQNELLNLTKSNDNTGENQNIDTEEKLAKSERHSIFRESSNEEYKSENNSIENPSNQIKNDFNSCLHKQYLTPPFSNGNYLYNFVFLTKDCLIITHKTPSF